MPKTGPGVEGRRPSGGEITRSEPKRVGVRERVGSGERVYWAAAAGLLFSALAAVPGAKIYFDEWRQRRHHGNKNITEMDAGEVGKLMEKRYPEAVEEFQKLVGEGNSPEDAARKVARGIKLDELFGFDQPTGNRAETAEEEVARFQEEKAAQKIEDKKIDELDGKIRAAFYEEVENFKKRTGLDSDPRTTVEEATRDRPLIRVDSTKDRYTIELIWNGKGGSGEIKEFEFRRDPNFRGKDKDFERKHEIEPLLANFRIPYNYKDNKGQIWDGRYFDLESVGADVNPEETARGLFQKFLDLALKSDRDIAIMDEADKVRGTGRDPMKIE